MSTLIDVILPVFVVIGFGYAVTARGWFTASAVDALMGFAQNFAIPLLLFRALVQIDIAASFQPLLLMSYYTGSVLCFIAGILSARLLFGRPWEDSIAIGMAAMFGNTVLLGLAITERAYGPDALTGNYTIIAFHVSFTYLLGIFSMEVVRARHASRTAFLVQVGRELIRNPLIIGALSGLAVNLSGLPLPGALFDAVDMLAQSALPAALFALGGILHRYRPEGDLRQIAVVCAISLILHPAVAYGLGRAGGLDTEALRSVVLTAAAAPGANAYIFANLYGVARRVVASSVLFGTAGCLLTCWFWLGVLP